MTTVGTHRSHQKGDGSSGVFDLNQVLFIPDKLSVIRQNRNKERKNSRQNIGFVIACGRKESDVLNRVFIVDFSLRRDDKRVPDSL